MNQRMKAVFLAAVFALSMAASAAMAATTEAKVAFIDGVLEFGELQNSNGMNIDFGTHTLPVGAVEYEAADGAHSLTVLDAKSTDDSWTVSAGVSKFTSGTVTNEFDGAIQLAAGSTNAGNVSAQDPVTLASGAADVLVVAGSNTATGSFVTTWQQANTKLAIDATNALTINQPAAYTATITWTMAVMP